MFMGVFTVRIPCVILMDKVVFLYKELLFISYTLLFH